MKDFFKKNKKVIIIILIALFLLSLGITLYFFVFKDMLTKGSDTQDSNISQEEMVTPLPEFDERSSSEAIEATYTAAKEWSSDVKLYDCSGLSTAIDYGDVKYEFIGFDEGKYYNWLCTYYSASKNQTKVFAYREGVIDDSIEAFDIGEYDNLLYGNVDYPKDPLKIVDSTVIYTDVIENGLNVENEVNMYLMNTQTYGFVWRIEERSKSQRDEYDIGEIINVYIFDIYTGDLKDIFQEEVY